MFGKRGDTLVNIAFLLGMLIIAAVVTSVLTKFSLFQGRAVEQDVLIDFTEKIKNTVEKTQSSPNDADFIVKLDFPLRYKLSVDEGRIFTNFPDFQFEAQAIYFNTDTNVIGTEIENAGEIYISKRGKTIFITDSLKCDRFDLVCDAGCLMEDLCDPACYGKIVRDVCNFYCVDSNDDNRITKEDADGICDPDCYGNGLRGGVYDPDCLLNSDLVCDPNSHNVKDDFCDDDCLPTNGVCDPDCKEYDVDCPHQDNGICEPQRGENCLRDGDCLCDTFSKTCIPACPGMPTSPEGCIDNTLLFPEGQQCTANCQCSAGLICDTKFGTNRCCPVDSYFDAAQNKCVSHIGDGICQIQQPYSETCQSSSEDCACQNGGCCPESSKADTKGCVQSTGAEGEACVCDAECQSPLICGKGACCPVGYEWNAEKNMCILVKKYKLLFVGLFYESDPAKFQSDAERSYQFFLAKTPFNQCANPSERVEKILAPLDLCKSLEPSCRPLWGSNFACLQGIKPCVDRSSYDYDLIIGMNNRNANPSGNNICGAAPVGVPVSLTDFPSACPEDSAEIAAGHESGHALGLYHVDHIGGSYGCGTPDPSSICRGPEAPDCNLPDTQKVNDIMTYCRRNENFGPASYQFLQDSPFNGFLEGCI